MITLTKTKDLEDFCEYARSFSYITIDTEFLREKTYFAKLCLVQLALPGSAKGNVVLVDPLTEDELSYKSLGYNLNFENPQHVQLENGFAEVMEAATGMMLIKRDVFKRMKKAYPERQYKTDQIINGAHYASNNCFDLFGVGKLPWDKDERYLSEDYYFSRLWSKIGGKIWADLASPLTHHGNMHFKGHVGAIFSTKDDTNKDTTQTGDTKTD